MLIFRSLEAIAMDRKYGNFICTYPTLNLPKLQYDELDVVHISRLDQFDLMLVHLMCYNSACLFAGASLVGAAEIVRMSLYLLFIPFIINHLKSFGFHPLH